MPDEVKLEPCPVCGGRGRIDVWEHASTCPYADKARAAIETTRPTAATDDVVKELLARYRHGKHAQS